MMKALAFSSEGAKLIEHSQPAIRVNEVRIAERACALNRVDLAMTCGHVHGGAGGVGNVLSVKWVGEVVAQTTFVRLS